MYCTCTLNPGFLVQPHAWSYQNLLAWLGTLCGPCQNMLVRLGTLCWSYQNIMVWIGTLWRIYRNILACFVTLCWSYQKLLAWFGTLCWTYQNIPVWMGTIDIYINKKSVIEDIELNLPKHSGFGSTEMLGLLEPWFAAPGEAVPVLNKFPFDNLKIEFYFNFFSNLEIKLHFTSSVENIFWYLQWHIFKYVQELKDELGWIPQHFVKSFIR